MVGEIHDEFDVVERPLTLAGWLDDFRRRHKRPRPRKRNTTSRCPRTAPTKPSAASSRTISASFPRGGESFEAYGYRFTVMEMEHRRVSRVKIKSVSPPNLPEAKEARDVNGFLARRFQFGPGFRAAATKEIAKAARRQRVARSPRQMTLTHRLPLTVCHSERSRARLSFSHRAAVGARRRENLLFGPRISGKYYSQCLNSSPSVYFSRCRRSG